MRGPRREPQRQGCRMEAVGDYRHRCNPRGPGYSAPVVPVDARAPEDLLAAHERSHRDVDARPNASE